MIDAKPVKSLSDENEVKYLLSESISCVIAINSSGKLRVFSGAENQDLCVEVTAVEVLSQYAKFAHVGIKDKAGKTLSFQITKDCNVTLQNAGCVCVPAVFPQFRTMALAYHSSGEEGTDDGLFG